MKIKVMLFALVGWTVLNGCEKEKTTSAEESDLTLNITGLEDLGSDYRYEGWAIDKDGNPTTTGVFTVSSTGTLSKTSFKVNKAKLDAATTFVLTIEPNPDTDPAPASTHILSGPFNNKSAALSLNHTAALGTDFSAATGTYILGTPSDNPNPTTPSDNNNELSGVWFLRLGAPVPPSQFPSVSPGLTLPTLPAGWKYEGWAVTNSVPLSTGTFTDPGVRDDEDKFFTRGNSPVPNYPGDDFIENAPTGVMFPVNLSGATIVVSVEPDPDNSTAPFLLKPLSGNVPNDAAPGMNYPLTAAATTTYPSGTASR